MAGKHHAVSQVKYVYADAWLRLVIWMISKQPPRPIETVGCGRVISASMAEDGYVHIVDRRKDMIITGGFNVYPNEVEQVISENPAVQECAVIGVPDEKWGEAVKAVVQLKPGARAEEDELIGLVKQRLGSVKAPKSVDMIERPAAEPVGKVLKTALRKPYWEGKDRGVN